MATVASSFKPKLTPDHSFTFAFEENFDVDWAIQWLADTAYVPIFMSLAVYLPVIYFGQKIMANREPIPLRGPLIAWNLALTIFSVIGFFRVAPEFFHALNNFGYKHTICNNSYLLSKPTTLWTWMFVLSKVPELMDTVFLVLKKQKLMFLHVYHHATVVIFSWFVLMNKLGSARWFCTMNFAVHSIMYGYYALKAMPNLVRVPKAVSMLITSMQTVQMMVGTYVVTTGFAAYMRGEQCATNTTMTLAGLGIYVSYLLLFSHFFYTSYMLPPKKARDDKKIA